MTTETSTPEPLPYDINYMTVTKVGGGFMVYDVMTVFQDVVYLIRPREKTEGSFPFIVPLADEVS